MKNASDGEPVDRERREHDEEEERSEHEVRLESEIDADSLAGHPDRTDARNLERKRDRHDRDHHADVAAEAVVTLVDGAQRPLETHPLERRRQPREPPANAAREDEDGAEDERRDAGDLDP